jgi:hypothetical protein
MLQELHGLYLAEYEEAAMAALDRFARMHSYDPLPEFYKVVDTLLKWAPEIFAFHKAGRISNGRLEGTNNKLGVLKRMAFGFVNTSNFEASRRLRARVVKPHDLDEAAVAGRPRVGRHQPVRRGLLLCPPRPALP